VEKWIFEQKTILIGDNMKVIAYPAFKTKYKNPYNWLLYTELQKQGVIVEEFSFSKLLTQSYDIFHLHWPSETITRHPNPMIALIRTLSLLTLIDWVKSKGTRLLWTVHDQTPSGVIHPKLTAWFQTQFIKRVDGCIHLCQHSSNFIQNHYSELSQYPSCVIPHGDYRQIYPNFITKNQAKAELSIPEDHLVLAYLGLIKPYKNIPHLIRVFKTLNLSNTTLLIAGQPESETLKQEILDEIGNCSQIQVHFEFIPDDKIQVFLNIADLVILPFKEILNSGSALLALSFNRPVLAPALGAMIDLETFVGQDWLKLYPGELTPKILQETLVWSTKTPRSDIAPLDALNWQIIAQQTMEFYQQLISNK
jgi:beta-1,4-mannosyltransferase